MSSPYLSKLFTLSLNPNCVTNNNLLKHYIPLEDGKTLYDIVSKTTFDVGKTFTATETDVTVNEKGEEIPGYEYKN